MTGEEVAILREVEKWGSKIICITINLEFEICRERKTRLNDLIFL